MSIAPEQSDFKSYCAAMGPGRSRPDRPRQCVFCDGERVWFNGWRRVQITLLVDGQPHRPDDGVLLQRVRCARRACRQSWTLRPPWLYAHRSVEPDIAEAAALEYLLTPDASYAAVARAVGCAWITVWRWVGWIAGLVAPAAVLAQAARLDPAGADPAALRREVPAVVRARTAARAQTVQAAAHVLVALTLWHRAQPEPPADPSPLRGWLVAECLTFRRVALLTRAGWSPALKLSDRPGHAVHGGHAPRR